MMTAQDQPVRTSAQPVAAPALASGAPGQPVPPTVPVTPGMPGAPGANNANGSTSRNGGKPSVWSWLRAKFVHSVDAIPLATKIVTCTVVLLIVGTAGISFTLRQLVSNYMLEKTDMQLLRQSQLVLDNIKVLSASSEDNGSNSLLNSYFLQIRDDNDVITSNALVPQLKDGVTSMPLLPPSGSRGGVQLQQPFTTTAHVTTNGTITDRSTLTTAEAPWRVVALPWVDKAAGKTGICYIGLSMSDQLDTTRTLTRYCFTVGLAIVILGALLATLLTQRTLAPLKRIEKTAAKIAAGDLSQRVPPAPENTEVGSLAASLNAMLARIEQSFHEQEETTEKMKRFVSDASHELRTPLAAIHGYAELYKMQRDLPGALERADESIEHIEASSSRMTVLVEDLLSLARLDEGRGIDITQQVPLTSLVADATDDLHALDPERAIRLGSLVFQPAGADGGSSPAGLEFVEGPLPEVTLKGDGSRLRQVVTNIVGNIHRYTPADSPVETSIGVMPASISPESLARMPANETSMRYFIEAVDVSQSMQMGMNYAVIRFSDHGPGVPAESRSKIFERFYTADPSRARLKGGTGLGMAIAQSVVKAHKGFICATGSQGGGLTLTVVLPIAPLEPASSAIPAASHDGKETRKGRTERQHRSK
nr:HAMP domain-containing sensor histidine kinase [Bifidobacterium goeldii]